MTYVSNICGEQDIVLQRNRKQFYGETRIQYYKEPGNSITEKQETVSWGCPIEPEKHEKDPPPPQPSYPRVLYPNFPLTFMLKT